MQWWQWCIGMVEFLAAAWATDLSLGGRRLRAETIDRQLAAEDARSDARQRTVYEDAIYDPLGLSTRIREMRMNASCYPSGLALDADQDVTFIKQWGGDVVGIRSKRR